MPPANKRNKNTNDDKPISIKDRIILKYNDFFTNTLHKKYNIKIEKKIIKNLLKNIEEKFTNDDMFMIDKYILDEINTIIKDLKKEFNNEIEIDLEKIYTEYTNLTFGDMYKTHMTESRQQIIEKIKNKYEASIIKIIKIISISSHLDKNEIDIKNEIDKIIKTTLKYENSIYNIQEVYLKIDNYLLSFKKKIIKYILVTLNKLKKNDSNTNNELDEELNKLNNDDIDDILEKINKDDLSKFLNNEKNEIFFEKLKEIKIFNNIINFKKLNSKKTILFEDDSASSKLSFIKKKVEEDSFIKNYKSEDYFLYKERHNNNDIYIQINPDNNEYYHKNLCIKINPDNTVTPCTEDECVDKECWYQINEKFYILYLTSKKEQNNEIMKITIDENTSYNLKIAYVDKKNKKAIIQDEKMFNTELSFFNKKQKSKLDKINKNLDTEITTDQIEFSIRKLSNDLLRIAPENQDYKYDSTYLNNVKECIINSNKKVKLFLEKIAGIIVFLKEEDTEIFKENIKNLLYTPYFLCNASYIEKFPEAIFDDSEDGKRNIIQLNEIINRYVKKINTEYYNTINPERINTQTDNILSYKFKYNNWTNQCENIEKKREIIKDENNKYVATIFTNNNSYLGTTFDKKQDAENDYENIKLQNNIISIDDKFNKYNIVKYEEEDKTYCLLIKKLLKDKKNYITGKELKKEFYEEIQKKYNDVDDVDVKVDDVDVKVDDVDVKVDDVDVKVDDVDVKVDDKKIGFNLFFIINKNIEDYYTKKQKNSNFFDEIKCNMCKKKIKKSNNSKIQTIKCDGNEYKKITFCNCECYSNF